MDSGTKKYTLAVVILSLVCLTGCWYVYGLSDDSERANPTSRKAKLNRHLLVLGGNGFIGSHVVAELIKEGYNITIVNRGNHYWDFADRILPFVQVIECDRQNGFNSCESLTSLIADVRHFSAVIDFSAFDAKDVKGCLTLISKKTGLYVLISSDSVYDVCEVNRSRPLTETDSVRPAKDEDRQRLASYHSYGDKKLKAEDMLVTTVNNTDLSYVILRLPDVIGSRDVTHRFWIYQLWIKMSLIEKSRPVSIPKYLSNYNNSFVYVNDIATLIAQILRSKTNAYNNIYNLAWHEPITMNDLLLTMASNLGLDGLSLNVDTASDNLYFYPSVRSGPISSRKATEMLDWKPTPWKKAISLTTKFFEEAMVDPKYVTQQNEIIQIAASHIFSNTKLAFYDNIEKVYGLNMDHFRPKRDEL